MVHAAVSRVNTADMIIVVVPRLDSNKGATDQ
jgi:hypothetical protein